MTAPLLRQFDTDNVISQPTGRHTVAAAEQDRATIIEELQKYDVLNFHNKREIHGLHKPKPLVRQESPKQLEKWIEEHAQKYLSL